MKSHKGLGIGIGVFSLGCVIAIIVMVVHLVSAPEKSAEPKHKSAKHNKERPAPRPHARPASLVDIARSASTLEEAIGFTKPFMKNTRNSYSDGAMLLAAWEIKHAQSIKFLIGKERSNYTSWKEVMKDPEEGAGKIICAEVRVIEIRAHRASYGKIFVGGMFVGHSMNLLRFIAVGSTKGIVQGSRSGFCGVVSGVMAYDNSGGGTSHAVQVVGMFTIKENGPKKPLKAARR